MRENATEPIDKSTWGNGPWQSEPDRIEWEHAGLPCLMVRQARGGFWCGYAAVPPGHPLHGKSMGEPDIDVHGGLTYANACSGHICHVPKPGEPDNVWWFGFDCHHAWDRAPGSDAHWREIGKPELAGGGMDEQYRDVSYVRRYTESLADQLMAMGKAADAVVAHGGVTTG